MEVLEKVSIFRRAVNYNDVSDILADKYSRYAEALAAQGRLQTAMNYLSQVKDPVRRSLHSPFSVVPPHFVPYRQHRSTSHLIMQCFCIGLPLPSTNSLYDS